MKSFTASVLVLFSFLFLGCSTAPQPLSDEEAMMALDEAAMEEPAATEEFEGLGDEMAAVEESFGEEAAAEPAPEEAFEEFAEEDFPQDEFSDEVFGQEVEDQQVVEQPPMELPEDPPLLEEPAVAEQAPLAPSFEEPAPLAGPPVEITNIKYLANQSGGSVVIDTSGKAAYQTRTNPETNQFVVEVANATLPDRLKRPFILKEFNAAFGAINAYQLPGSSTARVVIQLKNGATPIVEQEGGTIMVIPSSFDLAQADTPSSVPQDPAAKPSTQGPGDQAKPAADDSEDILAARSLNEFLTGNNKFYGRKISVQVSNADVREVINLISEESGANIVMADDVKGNVSLKLREVPWDQALVIVMRSKNLGYVRQGNVLRISTLAALEAENKAAQQIVESQKALTPVRVKVVPVSYSKVEDLVKQVQPFLTTNRGKVVADTRTSSLVITDTDEVLDRVTKLIEELDLPPAQVMIEGKVVEASEAFERRVGVNWNLSGSPYNLADSGGYNDGPISIRSGLTVQPIEQKVEQATGLFRLNVGTLKFLGDLNAALSLAEQDQLVRIVSSPRIVTLNKEKAEISQSGEVISISTVLEEGQTSKKVERTPVELKLIVTPQITAAGSVILDVDVKRQFAGGVEDEETLARAVNTRAANTKVLVKNGETAVIGGIYQSDENSSVTGVPLLKDIPVLGWLFKGKQDERQKNELLIFLTPRVLNPESQATGS